MALRPPVRLRVDDPSGVAAARRAAETVACDVGLDAQARGRVAIVVTELATNLLRHAGGGELIVRPGAVGLELVAWDRGPGIANVARARGDGFSTVGGSGTGLGAVERLSTSFDLQATPGEGTVVCCRIDGHPSPPRVDGLALAIEGETACGDAWAQVRDGPMLTVLLADGLGHGDNAATAANTAVRELRGGVAPETLMHRLHEALRPTRGAAAAIARIDTRSGALEFAGIGNIAATIVDGPVMKSLASMAGTLGHRVHRVRTFMHELPDGALLVLHSDGCRGNWDLARYPGALRRDPLVIASLLMRDCERGRDDVSVVVAKAETP